MKSLLDMVDYRGNKRFDFTEFLIKGLEFYSLIDFMKYFSSAFEFH